MICDSPLTGNISYERAKSAATGAQASLVIVESLCADESLWQQRIYDRKTLQLPAHHQTEWDAYQRLLCQSQFQGHHFTIRQSPLEADTTQSLQSCLTSVLAWLAHIKRSSTEEARKGTKPGGI